MNLLQSSSSYSYDHHQQFALYFSSFSHVVTATLISEHCCIEQYFPMHSNRSLWRKLTDSRLQVDVGFVLMIPSVIRNVFHKYRKI